MAQTYSQRPSDLWGIDHPLLAWDFDRAVSYFGSYVESRLNERDNKGKPVTSLKALLRLYDPISLDDFRDMPGVRIHDGS